MSLIFDQFFKKLGNNEKISITFIYKTHKIERIQTDTKFNETESCIRNKAHFIVEFQMDDFSVIWEFRLDAQILVLLLLELNCPCLHHRQLSLGSQRLIPSENCLRWMEKWGINSRSKNTVLIHCRTFPAEFSVF